jgi:hypothetical protein
MFALPSIADIVRWRGNVRFVPRADINNSDNRLKIVVRYASNSDQNLRCREGGDGPEKDIASKGETAAGPRLVRRISPNAKIKALQSLSISSPLTMSAMR